jgi:hypothetical protein
VSVSVTAGCIEHRHLEKLIVVSYTRKSLPSEEATC